MNSVFCYHSALELLGVAHSMWKKGIRLYGSTPPAVEAQTGRR